MCKLSRCLVSEQEVGFANICRPLQPFDVSCKPELTHCKAPTPPWLPSLNKHQNLSFQQCSDWRELGVALPPFRNMLMLMILPSSSSLSSRLASLLSFLSWRSISALIRFCSCCSSERQHAITAAAIHEGRGARSPAYPKPHPNLSTPPPPPSPAQPANQLGLTAPRQLCPVPSHRHRPTDHSGITASKPYKLHPRNVGKSMKCCLRTESSNKMEEEQRRVCAGGRVRVRMRGRPAST